jgi:hypothetical protein
LFDQFFSEQAAKSYPSFSLGLPWFIAIEASLENDEFNGAGLENFTEIRLFVHKLLLAKILTAFYEWFRSFASHQGISWFL